MPQRQAFQDDLRSLQQDVVDMASLAERALAQGTESLVNLDFELARKVIREDDEIDRRDVEIEQHCLRIIALQHPTAKDLRIVGACMKLTTDIERVGDLAVELAKIAIKLRDLNGNPNVVDLHRIASVARRMLLESVEAFVKRDLETVDLVVRSDDEMDALYREYREQLHEIMQKHPEKVIEASWLMLAIHHLERVGDHSVNIAERVFFMETGRLAPFATRAIPPSIES